MSVTTRKTNSGFFGTKTLPTLSSIKADKKPVFIDVGGDGDCGFRSVAAGLLDNVMSKKRIKAEVITKLLARHFTYFPMHRSSANRLMTPDERLTELLLKVNMPELVRTLAYTLRQISVDEISKSPAHYRGAFVQKNEDTSPEAMREASTWIDESVIAALANSLDIPIRVSMLERGKELPMRLVYNETSSNPLITMQLQHGHYIPAVNHSERFNTVKLPVARKVEPMTVISDSTASLTEIMAAIDEDDKRLVSNFESNSHRLSTMVAAGELNKSDLITLYIRGMGDSDYLKGRIKYMGTEHGNQHLFDTLFVEQSDKPVALPHGNHEEQVVKELVRAISRAVSIGQMDAEVVFAQIDNKESDRLTINHF